MSEMNLTYYMTIKGVLSKDSLRDVEREAGAAINKLQGSLPPIKLRVALDEGSVADLRNRLGGAGPLGGGVGRSSPATKPGEGPAAAIERVLRQAAGSAGRSEDTLRKRLIPVTAAAVEQERRARAARNAASIRWARTEDLDERSGAEAIGEARYRQAMATNKSLTSEFSSGGRKESDRIKARLKGEEALAKASEKASKNLTSFGEGLQMIQRGAFRAGISKMVSGVFGGDSMAGAFVGAFSGVVASAIAFPIAWAIGDAVMKLPGAIDAHVGTVRYRESLGVAQADTVAGASALNQLGGVEAFVAKLKDTKGNPLRPQVASLMQTYINRGFKPGDTERMGQFAAVAALLSGVGLEEDPARMMAELKDLTQGNADEQANAVRSLAARPYIKKRMLDKLMEGKDKNNPAVRQFALQRLNYMLARPYGYAYTDKDILGEIKGTIVDDPRMKRYAFQQTQLRGFLGMLGEQGNLENLMFQLPGEWTLAQQRYAKDYEMFARRRAAGKDSWTRPSGFLGLGKEEITFEEAVQDRRDRYKHKGKHIVDYDTVERWIDRKLDQSSLLPDDINRKPPWYYPSEFRMTTFSGLAENMQQMWGGLPADVATDSNTEATKDLTGAIKELAERIQADESSPVLKMSRDIGIMP